MRSRSMSAAVGAVLLAATVAACAASNAGAPPASPSPATFAVAKPAASFSLSALDSTFQVSAKAATNSCHTPASGAWSYLYTGIDPFMTMELTVYPGAAATVPTGDFDLYFEFADERAYQLTPSKRREEVAGSGTVQVTRGEDGATIEIAGSAEGRAATTGAVTDVHLVLTCPD